MHSFWHWQPLYGDSQQLGADVISASVSAVAREASACVGLY
jgi:hypothetical protein